MSLSDTIMMREGKGGAIVLLALLLAALAVLAFALGVLAGFTGPFVFAIAIGAITMGIVLLLRLDQFCATCILLTHLYVDWYLGLSIVAQAMVMATLAFFFIGRSSRYPWKQPRLLWLWGLLLVLAIEPAIRGAFSRYDLGFYYPNIILGGLLMLWLGTTISTNLACVRRFFKFFASFGALLALITIMQDKTGILLLSSSRFNMYLVNVSGFTLTPGGDIFRLGSYLVNPDWNGAFFAMIFFIPLSLLVESDALLAKLFYLIEALLMLPALLFTYSIGAWISIAVGIGIFVLLVGHMSYRILIILFTAIAAIVLIAWFPEQLSALSLHASNPDSLMLRNGAWLTAIKVIQAFPLSGVGMGLQAYMTRSEPYRVPMQYRPLVHPHNSYLELGAMAGLPILVIFVTLLLSNLWIAFTHWRLADTQQKAILSGGIAAVIALSINSLSVNGWTLPPLAAIGWLILGSVSSPSLMEEKNNRAPVSVLG